MAENKKKDTYLGEHHAQEKDDKNAYERGRIDQKKTSRILLIAVSAATLILGGVLGVSGYKMNENNNSDISPLTKEIFNYLVDDWLYAGTIEDLQGQLNQFMIDGMLDNDGDPYTFYTSTYAGQGLNTSGSGIYGVRFANYSAEVTGDKTYGGLLVSQLYDGTLKEAGVQEGDVIIGIKHSIEDEYTLVETMTPDEAGDFTKPTKDGEDVYFEIVRNNSIVEFSCTTGDYKEVPASLENDEIIDGKRVVTVKVSTFLGDSVSGKPADMSEDIIDNCLTTGEIDRLVFDMRSNGGGYTQQASELAGLFLPKGDLIYQMGDLDGNMTDTYYQTNEPKYNFDDIRILLNGGSASATELFAKALKDNGIAEIYGSQSYGKGIAQSVINLENGGTLRITTGKVYGPDGTSIHGVGITPDVMTNDYDKYTASLVSTPYQEDSYRLSYQQEQAVVSDLKLSGSDYSSVDSYTDGVSLFQTNESIAVSGEYDKETLYRIYYKLLKQYFSGQDTELAKVEGK